MASPKWKVYLIVFPTVTPAKAGVQGNKRALASLDPGFRRDDEEKREARTPADSLQKQAGPPELSAAAAVASPVRIG